MHYARSQQFPIVQTPGHIRFADIIQAYLQAKQNWLDEHTSPALPLPNQQHLLHLFLNGSELTDMAEYCYLKLHTPVLILDKRGMIKGSSDHTKWGELEKWAAKHVSFYDLEDQLLALLEIRVGERLDGYITLVMQSEASLLSILTADNRTFLEHATTVSAL